MEQQARFLQELTRDTCRTNFTFAGFVESDGHPVLRQISSPGPDYWGWGKLTASVVLLFHKTSGDYPLRKIAEPLPFTPLFIFNGDRQQLVNKAAADSAYPTNQIPAILPPFFLQSRE
jgi:hypothetical protein